MILEIEDLVFSWKTKSPPILNIPSFQVQPQEKIFLQGPSGSGKTTLLSLIGGILLAQSGTLRVLETDLKQLPGAKRDAFRVDHLGFIFQMFNLLPYLSLIDNVLLPCHFSNVRRQRIGKTSKDWTQEAFRLLTTLGLAQEAKDNRSVLELSVGQQQRVAAARALIGKPELLIADEPTSALDADTREVFLNLLFQECNAAGITLIFVSHDRSLTSLFDRTYSLKDLSQSER